MISLSVLDLAPIVQGGDAARAFHNSRDLAQHVERWGYRRFWLAEHHGMPGIASAATSIVIAHVAAGTSRIRVGAGGIMLPNHSPLVVAEQFGTLESLYPGRIDLALGRAPGTDPLTARALRRHQSGDAAEAFPQDVLEVMQYFRGADGRRSRARGPGRRAARAGVDSRIEPVRRVPRSGARPAVRVRVALRAGAADGRDRACTAGSSRRPNSSIARA